jgi:hypothetical protein
MTRLNKTNKEDIDMARLNTMPEPMGSHLADLPCPTFETRPRVPGPTLDRPHELAADHHIGSVAQFHYSFMGAADPNALQQAAGPNKHTSTA